MLGKNCQRPTHRVWRGRQRRLRVITGGLRCQRDGTLCPITSSSDLSFRARRSRPLSISITWTLATARALSATPTVPSHDHQGPPKRDFQNPRDLQTKSKVYESVPAIWSGGD